VIDEPPPEIETLYLQYGASVVRRATQILHNADDAQEILQEVFARLIARPALLHTAREPAMFLYAVTTNACLNRLRNLRNRDRLVERELRPWHRDLADGSAQDLAIVLDLLVKLPEDQASAAVYYHLDGMSHHEIADVLGCSRRHVGNLLDRARLRVRELVEEAI
jgi:RNA polymerase sigma-70 factor (ECF subfamily)